MERVQIKPFLNQDQDQVQEMGSNETPHVPLPST